MKNCFFTLLLLVVLIVVAFFGEWIRICSLLKLIANNPYAPNSSVVMMRTPDGEVLEVNAKDLYDSNQKIVEATSEDGKTYFVHILIRDKEEIR